jgi:acetyl-CoA carboxylase biotin carboxyl carrier protein
MPDRIAQIDQLAALMDEFGLTEAEYTLDGFRVGYRKAGKVRAVEVVDDLTPIGSDVLEEEIEAPSEAVPAVISGNPITSPMTGIYYGAPSPQSAPFVKEGDSVTAGDVVALIEAMKVFNEVTATVSGVVKKLNAESGQIVNPGDVLMIVG